MPGPKPDREKYVIAICSYKRPRGLKDLLQALTALDFGDEREQTTVLVVDNDPEGSAESLVLEVAANSDLPMVYRHAAPRGLVAARNSALAFGREQQANLMFLDDDELPEPSWFAAMVEMHNRFPDAIVAGPIRPVFERPLPDWSPRGEYWTRSNHKDAESLVGTVPDANILFPVSFHHTELFYDMKYNTSGAQDTHLLGKWLAAGGQIVWAAGAATVEAIPAGRMTLEYAVERRFFESLTFTWVERDRGVTVLRPLARAAYRGIRGVARSIWGGWTGLPRIAAAGRLDLSVSRGIFAGLRLREFDRYRYYQFDTPKKKVSE